ncbi:hypothetical protein SEA_ZAYULIV_48 [Microbacterium phage Zayuliv]|nr:hypothetical protein SEA_ZAYULIV_48 [Microbacterium phage Zayuliv]
MAQTIHLNGGPWHDRRVSLEDGHQHFHIMESPMEAVQRAIREMKDGTPPAGMQRLPLREGTYSSVRNYPGEFEWDGWVTCD